MHEASVVEALVKMVTEAVPDKALAITKIRLVVGESTGYMESSLAFYLKALAKGTSAQDSGLEVRYVKQLLRCPACRSEFARRPYSFSCPACGAQGEMTATGSEFYVDSIEVAPVGEREACAST
jgi:hydrogenase nickel incorporation protein HypA/HybF